MATIKIYSNTAKRLMVGRKGDIQKKKYPIMGINGFASLAHKVTQDAKKGNPFAAWYLIRLEERMTKVEGVISELQAEYELLLKKGLGIDYPDIEKKSPEDFRIDFATPYGWSASRYIIQLDQYHYQILSLANIGLLKKRDAFRSMNRLSKAILGSFNELKSYESFLITNDDVINKTALFKQACEAMGMIPRDIIVGKLSPNYL